MRFFIGGFAFKDMSTRYYLEGDGDIYSDTKIEDCLGKVVVLKEKTKLEKKASHILELARREKREDLEKFREEFLQELEVVIQEME